jgi:hypothetical protein
LKQKKKRQKSHDAAAWASFAPLLLYCRNHLGGIHMPRILAQSEGEGGGGRIDKIGRGVHLPHPKSSSCFQALFLKAREAPLKKRKRGETARLQFLFSIKKGIALFN